MKKVIATLLAVMMVFGVMAATVASAEVTVTAKGFTLPAETANVDWAGVAADENGDFAMLCAYDGGAVAAFEDNYQGAKAAGVQVGAYLVMKATTVDQVNAEAVGMLKAIAGKQFELPICVQVPQEAPANIESLVLAMMNKLSEGGRLYLTVFVTNDFANNNESIMSSWSGYDTWFTEADDASVTATDIADPSYAGYHHICEYAYGDVNGVKGPVGLDYVKDYDFASIMNNANLNGYGTSEIVAPADPVDPPVDDPTNPEDPTDPDTPVDPDDPQDPVTDTDTPTDTDVTGTDVTLGDVDMNGKIDAKDALAVLKFAVGKTELTADQQKAAEVDGKEGIGARDALEILKYTVKKITKFPIEG